MTFTNSLAWRGVSCAHGTAIAAISRCLPCARDTLSQTKAFVNVIYFYFKIYLGDSVEMKCTEAEMCFGHTMTWWCFGIVTECYRVSRFDMWCIQFVFKASVMHTYCHNCHFQLFSMRTTLAWNSNWMQPVSKRLTLHQTVKFYVL